jgi:4-amino-4-deoxy-L-arabinose transferase-like glycosyltransferase
MQKRILFGIIISGSLVALFAWLGYMGLRAEEPRRALVSIEMMQDGDYILPHMFGWPYYNKPPLFNWLMILCFKLFGSTSEWVVRMPSMIALILLSFLNYSVIKKYINKEVALLSSFFIITSAEILFYGSLVSGEIDLFFTLVIYVHIMAIFICLQQKKYLLLFLLSYFLTGVGFLTKGLPSIAFQGLTLITALILFRRIRLLFSWRHVAGVLIFLFIAGGYVYLLFLKGEHSGFLVRQFKEASQRTGLETSILDTLIGIVSVPLNLTKLLLPWSFFFLLIFRKGMVNKIKENKLVLFLVFFILVNFPLYWFTGDFKARYVYPFLPFFCILLSYFYLFNLTKFPKTIKVIEVIFGVAILIFPLGILTSFFIPEIRSIKTNQFISVVLILIGITLSYFYFVKPKIRIYLVLILLVSARIAMNNIYLPVYRTDSRTTYYKNIVKDILTITKGEAVYMSGNPTVYNSTIQFGKYQWLSQEVSTAPVFAFQIPYYITQQTGKIVLYEKEIERGRYYLIDEYSLNLSNSTVLYEYFDKTIFHTWYLIEMKE